MLNGIITKTNARDKVIDFRDGLVVAKVDDYAMMHGAGGKDHAPVSVIKIGICDYTAGTGESSKTVFANITPDVCAQLYEVCKQNLGTMSIDSKFPMFVEQRAANRKMGKFADMGVDILNKALSIMERVTAAADKGNTPGFVDIMKVCQMKLAKTQERVMTNDAYSDAAFMAMPRHLDFNYTQDRVHNQKKGQDGFAPVQRLVIYHQTFRKDGALSNYPWTVKITNGEARVREQATGATTFEASSLRNTKEAFIQVSDADMFRMMDRINRFISVWEMTFAASLVKEGEAKREEERQAFIYGQQQ